MMGINPAPRTAKIETENRWTDRTASSPQSQTARSVAASMADGGTPPRTLLVELAMFSGCRGEHGDKNALRAVQRV